MGLLTASERPTAPSAAVTDAPGLDRLDDADPAVRRAAALAARGTAAATQPLLARLRHEPDLAVRQALFDGLVSLGTEDAATGLADLLMSEDAHLRNEAISALSEMPEAAPIFIEVLLQASDADVRIFAVNILRDLRHPRAVEWLSRVIETDPHPNVVGTALDHVLELAPPEIAKAVTAAAARFAGTPYIAFVCRLILDRLQTEGA